MPDLSSDTLILDQLTDVEALAGTMWAEAAGDSREGNSSVEERIAVGCVIRTRLVNFRMFGSTEPTFKGVCLAHTARGVWQFDCWRPGSGPNHSRLMAQMELVAAELPSVDRLLRETIFLAMGIIDGSIIDRTNGANFYYAPKSMVPPGSTPGWARGKQPVADIGDQLFFNLK